MLSGLDITKVIPASTMMKAESVGGRVKRIRDGLGLSQEALAKKAGISQVAIKKIESGDTRKSKFMPEIARALGVPLSDLDPSQISDIGPMPLTMPKTHTNVPLVGDRTLPVYGAVEGGDGALIMSSEPVDYVRRPAPLAEVKDGYGFIIIGESMVPEFKPGETGLVHPHLPPVPGEPCVFYASDEDGTERAMIKSLVRATQTHWHVEQWNPPKKFSLARKEWQKCHRVVGKYSRR